MRERRTSHTQVAVSKRTAGARLLLVEDDRAIQEVMRLILVEEGYEVDIAELPERAVEALQHARYDLVLTDLFGATPAAGLAAVQPVLAAASAPVGVCTGFALSSELMRDAGFAFMVPKPFDLDGLVDTIARALAECGWEGRAPETGATHLRLFESDREVAL